MATPHVKVSHTKRNIAVGVALLLLILVLAGAAYKPSPETTTTQTSATVAQTTSPEKQYDVVIRYTESYQRRIGYLDANKGNTFLIVTLEIHNNIDQALSTNPSNFYVIASSVKYDLDSATYFLPDTLQSVEALKGGTVTGSIAFQVPLLTTSYQLFYEAPFTSFDINWVHNVASSTQQSQEQLIMESYSWNFAGGAITLTIRNVGPVPVDAPKIDAFPNNTLVNGGLGTGCVTTLTQNQACVATFNVPTEPYVQGTAYPLMLVTNEGRPFSFSVIAGASS